MPAAWPVRELCSSAPVTPYASSPATSSNSPCPPPQVRHTREGEAPAEPLGRSTSQGCPSSHVMTQSLKMVLALRHLNRDRILGYAIGVKGAGPGGQNSGGHCLRVRKGHRSDVCNSWGRPPESTKSVFLVDILCHPCQYPDCAGP